MTISNVSFPSEGVRAPSAIVSGFVTVWRVLVLNDRVASSPAAGSTPMTLQPGDTAEAAAAQPEISPPPPTHTNR